MLKRITILSLGALIGSATALVGACEAEEQPSEHPVGDLSVLVPSADSVPAIAPLEPQEDPGPGRRELALGVARFVHDWSQREATFMEDYQAAFVQALGELGWFRKLTTRAYEHRNYELVFTDGQALTAAGHAMVQALAELETHGLDPEPYGRERLDKLLTILDSRRQQYETAVAPAQQPKERALWQVIEHIRGLPSTVRSAGVGAQLEKHDLTDDDMAVLRAVEGRVGDMFKAKDHLNVAARDVDLALMQAWYRYVYDMRYARRAHPFDADKNDGDGVERTAETLWEHFLKTDFDQLENELTALWPQHPDYEGLRKGLAFYSELAENAEQVELPRAARRLKKGSRNAELVKKLEQRLAQEAYFEGEPDGTYDDATAEAVRFYQETHQIKETGELDKTTVNSLNIDFKIRKKLVALGLQRMRESDLHQGANRFGEVPYQARVNIPAFRAYFYKDGVEARRHRIVVGNNSIAVDEETGEKGWFNRTRLFSEEIRTIVLNPTWKVPSRIKEQELDRELIDQPDFYEKHNYEVRILDDGSEDVVQLPGPNNALGLVKFLFPNRFSIYMHDTPNKILFNREIRAFSHGCMRTENPLELARWILVDVEGMEPRRFEQILKAREEYGIALENKIPITVEYNTVGVHESGKIEFYLDVYRFDRDYFAGKTPYPRARPEYAHFEQVVLVK